jgi:membrane-bound lytic murein transglycosylase B
MPQFTAFRLLRFAILLPLLFLWAGGPAHGVDGGGAKSDFADWLEGVHREGLERGVREETLRLALAGLKPIPRVIELDRRQPEFTLTFAQYLARVASAERIRTGRRKLRENRKLLDEIGRHYGIAPQYIVALWGIETDYGRLDGGFPVIGALATLAYDGRRSSYFRKELMNALIILDEGHITLERMKGSWAGAMGQNQFMPSSFRRFARDYDGDGHRDIWGSKADVFASAATFLKGSGWKKGERWGRLVQLPAAFDPALAGLEVKKTLGEWQALGIRRLDGDNLPASNLQASILLPGGADGPAYAVYENFRAILRWNRSNYFALTVGSLADRIAGP